MIVLVTGGAGFIGSALCRRLANDSRYSEVRVIDDLSTGDLSNLAGVPVAMSQGSILDEGLLDEVVRDVDSIVHLGAIPSVPRSIANPCASHDANATGTMNVLEAAKRHDVGQVIVASSSSVYGSNPALPKSEDDYTRPMSPYAVSKLATEGYALAYQHSYGLKTLPFRFFNVFGPGQAADHAYAAVIPRFVAAALADRPVTVHGDGLQSRDFTYVETVCSVIEDAIARRVHSSFPVNLAYNTRTTLLQLLDELEIILDRPIARTFEAPRPGDVRASQADPTRLSELFPDIEPVGLEQGLKATVEWYKTRAQEEDHHA